MVPILVIRTITSPDNCLENTSFLFKFTYCEIIINDRKYTTTEANDAINPRLSADGISVNKYPTTKSIDTLIPVTDSAKNNFLVNCPFLAIAIITAAINVTATFTITFPNKRYIKSVIVNALPYRTYL